RLEGHVVTELLQRAWRKIIERHEILRTTFHEVDGAPVQRVSPEVQFRLTEIDLGSLPAAERQAEGDRIGSLEARAPFDLAAGPLLRVTLLRYSEAKAIVLVMTHQIVSDGWSIGVMAREMGVIYQALRSDLPVPLEPLPIQYADYSLWHLEWLRVRGTDAETAYWAKQLAGVKPFQVIPDRARPALPTTNGAIVSRLYPRELTNRAQAVTAERGATLFAAALAALCATLSRFTGHTEIVIGTQVSDRDQVELEPMVGQFVNSLVLRNDLQGNPPFSELILRIRDTVAAALEHRHIPIERLLGMIKGERNHANSPPISVNFIFQKTFIHNSHYGDFDLIDMPSLPAGAIYDLNFFMVERPDGWRFSCQFNTDQFESSTAERLLAYIQSCLESGVSNPERRISELELSKPGEARLLLDKLNNTRTLYPRDLGLAKLFEVQTSNSPDAVAVIAGERRSTYAELNNAANRVARYLKREGIGTGAKIGLCVQPGIELPALVLGVVKAGGAYLLMDPSAPTAWLEEIAAAAGIGVIIGSGHASPVGTLKKIDVEKALSAQSGSAVNVAPDSPQDAARGVCLLVTWDRHHAKRVVALSHRNIANLVYSLAKRPGIASRDVVVATSLDVPERAVVEIFLPLLTGACLVIAADPEIAAGRPLLTLLQNTGATCMYGTPRTWRNLLEAGWVGFPTLKMLCNAAEMPIGLLDQLSSMSGELWSLYGHPETTVCSAVRRVKPKETAALVGVPIANTSLQVIDVMGNPAPVGASGELTIAGDGLVMHAGAAEHGYASGETARLTAHGQIEVIARCEHRFMVDGREISTSAIETVLRRHSDIAEAAVVQASSPSGRATLTAYIVPRATGAPPLATLTESVRALSTRSLPGFMVPSSIVVRDSLPRLAGGEPDRAALRASKAPAARADSDDPPSAVERRLAELWRSMLGVNELGPTANFFESGGHSLLAARMLTRVEKEFGRRIKLATLFLAPTLREFAKILVQADLREFDFRQVVKIQPHGSKRPLIAINNTGIYYSLAKNLGAEQPVYSLQLFDPSINDSTLPTSLEEIAAGYVALIRRVQPQGPYDLMGWCVAGALA
ncbi:MAG: condensation domain-containing protein, partial [Pseudomonadota bacterium]|nr:condensation domain-containing protein [Pseudomonadota bacterium]